MPSKYRPQIVGWFGDLDKGPYSLPLHDDRLIFANDTIVHLFVRNIMNKFFIRVCILLVLYLELVLLLALFGYWLLNMMILQLSLLL